MTVAAIRRLPFINASMHQPKHHTSTGGRRPSAPRRGDGRCPIGVETKEEEERMKRKAQELKEAGKATAHDAVREGQQGYENFKV